MASIGGMKVGGSLGQVVQAGQDIGNTPVARVLSPTTSTKNWEAVGDFVGLDSSGKIRRKRKAGEQASADYYGRSQDIAGGLDVADIDYQKRFEGNIQKYQQERNPIINKMKVDIQNLSSEASRQANDAQANYTNVIQPKYRNLMEQNTREAAGAMSLAEAGNPNNQIQRAVREMYGQQGKGAMKQGIADTGVLSAMGAQAAATQLAGLPISGAMLQGVYAQNQSQAGEATARAQQRMYDLQQQGIERGFEESGRQYERGERSRDRAAASIGDYEGSQSRNLAQQQGLRGERYGYGSDIFGLDMGRTSEDYELGQGRADLARDIAYGQGGRQQAIEAQKYGAQQTQIANDINRMSAQNAGRIGMIGTIGGGIFGGMAGGPMGAMQGAQMGGQIGGQLGQAYGAGYGQGGYQTPSPYGYPQQNPYGRYG